MPEIPFCKIHLESWGQESPCWQLSSQISTPRKTHIPRSSTLMLLRKFNQLRLVLKRTVSQLNLILQNPERCYSSCSLIGHWKKSLSEFLIKILVGENRFGFSRHSVNEIQLPLTHQSQSGTTHLQSKNKNEITSASNFITVLQAPY